MNTAIIRGMQVDARGKPRVWVCREKSTGRPRGDGIVGYEIPQAASLAIERFNSMFISLHSCLILSLVCA